MHDNYLDERSYLAETLSYIDVQIALLESEAEKDREDLSETQRDSNKSMIYVEDIYDLINVTTSEADVAHARSSLESTTGSLERLQVQRSSPYFGRVDIRHEDEREYEKVYIGRFSLLDADTYRAIIYDWRAPISSIYYEDVGDVKYIAPSGEQRGNVNLKRQFKIEEGALCYLFDSDVTVNDEMLAQALAQSSGDRLKNIVTTIQREQNIAIRHTGGDVLVVFGPAGSGKTSVGMHRLAWLLYNDREKLSARNCLIVSSSTVFSSYIADVLPDLGEESVLSVVFDKLFDISGYHEQIAYVSGASSDDKRMEDIRIKYSQSFMEYIHVFFEEFEFVCSDVVYRGHMICSTWELAGLIYDGEQRFPFITAYNRIKSRIESACEEFFIAHKDGLMKIIADDSEEHLFADEVAAIYNSARRQFTFESIRNFESVNALNDISELYRQILHKYSVAAGVRLGMGDELYEDKIVMRYIAALVGVLEPRHEVSQLLLDEAQDYSPLHISLLRHLFPKAKFTVLADTQQAIYQNISLTSQGELLALFPGADTLELHHSYRCTKEIFEFACSFVGATPAQSYARSGDEPKVISADSNVAISEILSDADVISGTVAIITRTTLEAREIHSKMVQDASLITKPDSRLSGGVTVLPMYFVKGLEFDTVILVHCENPDEALGGNLMYTLCTRALHRLYIIR